MLYNIRDHYWLVAGDVARAWSSARAKYVPATDADFLAWKSTGTAPTVIDTEESLQWVFDQGGYPEGWYGSKRLAYTSLEWSARLTLAEKLAIAVAQRTNESVWLVAIDMASAKSINVTDQRTIDGVNALVAAKVLTAARGKELLAL